MRSTFRFLLLGGALAALFATSACTVSGGVRARTVRPQPSLVSIGTGVYVVENHNRAVFYSDGYYWWASDGVWYRSTYHDRGWGYVDVAYVPTRVRRIDRPRAYVNYRARAGARVRRGPPPRVYDHRGGARGRTAPPPRGRTAPPPRGRDHRAGVRGGPSSASGRRSTAPSRPTRVAPPPRGHGKAHDHRRAKPAPPPRRAAPPPRGHGKAKGPRRAKP